MRLLERIRQNREKKAPLYIDIEKVSSSRAIYQGEGRMPTVQFNVQTTDGDNLVLEMNFEQTREAIEDLTHTYYAIIPPIRNKQSGG